MPMHHFYLLCANVPQKFLVIHSNSLLNQCVLTRGKTAHDPNYASIYRQLIYKVFQTNIKIKLKKDKCAYNHIVAITTSIQYGIYVILMRIILVPSQNVC